MAGRATTGTVVTASRSLATSDLIARPTMSTTQLLTRPQSVLGDAIVADATLVAATTDGRHLVTLSLLVVGADQTTEAVSVQVSVAPVDLPRIHPGASLTVRLDPNRPAQLRLPWFLTTPAS